MKKHRVISLDLTIGPYGAFLEEIVALAKKRVPSYVCVANVHMAIEAWRNSDFAAVVNNADIATPDGMPLAKSLHLLYGIKQERVAGMDLMPDLIAEAGLNGLSIFFFGSTDDILSKVTERVGREHPEVKVAGAYSPPFRSLSKEEEDDVIERLNDSAANIIMVALGCPKQEFWMARHKGKVNAVMVGVGGAFPVYAGMQKRAPKWMQKASLEWFFRLIQEPGRLLSRYLTTNSIFIVLLVLAFFKKKLFRVV
jgi:N-acetylglucosaminyldiphosphoundecaprenol N-acetyl-beta-D-mannosaminyltransferase